MLNCIEEVIPYFLFNLLLTEYTRCLAEMNQVKGILFNLFELKHYLDGAVPEQDLAVKMERMFTRFSTCVQMHCLHILVVKELLKEFEK